MDITNRNYEKFNAEERFKLVLTAAARSDEKEMQRLWDTCPIREYRMQDMQFRGRMLSYIMLGDVFFKLCVCLYADIEKADDFISDTLEEREYIQEHKIKIEPISEDTLKIVKTCRDISIAKLKALYLAFNDFCLTIEINSEDVLSELPIKHACTYIDRWLSSKINADENYRVCAKEMFLKNWGFKKIID